MEKRVVKKNGRDKAFIGAIVGSVANIAGGIISAKKKKKADELAFQQAQTEQTRIDGITQAAALSAAYNNQDYVNQYQDKITLKNGGKVKIKKGDNNDRIGKMKKFAIGGRKKSGLGSLIGEAGIGGEATGAVGGIGGLVTSLFTKPSAPKMVKKADGFTFNAPKTELAANSYQTDANGNPVTMLNTNNNLVTPDLTVNPVLNKLSVARMGKLSKRSLKSGL